MLTYAQQVRTGNVSEIDKEDLERTCIFGSL